MVHLISVKIGYKDKDIIIILPAIVDERQNWLIQMIRSIGGKLKINDKSYKPKPRPIRTLILA